MLLRHAMYVNEKVNQCQPKHVYSCVHAYGAVYGHVCTDSSADMSTDRCIYGHADMCGMDLSRGGGILRVGRLHLCVDVR